MPIHSTAGTGGSASSYRTQWVVLYDRTNFVYFLRRYTVNSSDAVTATTDFELDGTTLHTAGAVIEPAGDFSIQTLAMEDDNQEFLRHFVSRKNSVVSTFDTELDGTTSYTVSGTVHASSSNATSEVIPRLDDNSGIMTPFWRVNYYKNGTLQSSSAVDASGAAYTITGTERSITGQYELIDTYYLDVTDASAVSIIDAKADTTGAALGSLPANVISAFIKVEITSLDADGVPSGFIYAKSDGGGTVGSAATPGYKLRNRDQVLLGEAAQAYGDPAEIANFSAIADSGETATLTITLLRKRG